MKTVAADRAKISFLPGKDGFKLKINGVEVPGVTSVTHDMGCHCEGAKLYNVTLTLKDVELEVTSG